MSVHPFVRPGQAPEPNAESNPWQSADPYQAAAEQWWPDEDEPRGLTRAWLGIAMLVGLGIWLVVGSLAWLVFGW